MPSLTNSIVYRVTVSGGITYVYVQSLNMIGEGPFYGGTILSTSAIATLVYTQETETNSDHVESDAWAAVGLEPPLTWSVLVSGQIHEYTPEDEVTTSSPGFSGDGVLELSPNTDPGGDIDPPTNLSQTSATTTTVDVSWTPVIGATSYSFSIDGSGNAPADSSGNSAVFTGLTAGTSYNITVTATDGTYSSTPAPLEIKTIPGQPAGISQTSATTTTVDVSWTVVTGATGYSFTIDGSGNAPADSVSNSAVFTGLTAGSSYNITVTAKNTAGDSTPSSSFTIKTKPGQPTGLFRLAGTTTSVSVSWIAVTGATGYSFTIVGKTAPADTSVNNVVFTGLTPGTSYIITVTAKNTAGSSISSDNFTITANNNINDIPCFKEDTKILTDKGYRPIKDLRKGDMVKTIKEGFRPIKLIGYMPFQNNPSHERLRNQLYIYQKNNIPELTEDLVLTGGHCVLVRNFVGDQQQMVNNTFGNIFLTEGYYRLPSYFDERSDIYQTAGPFNVYHLCLDGIDDSLNHGIYANGFLVESSFTVELKKRKWTLL